MPRQLVDDGLQAAAGPQGARSEVALAELLHEEVHLVGQGRIPLWHQVHVGRQHGSGLLFDLLDLFSPGGFPWGGYVDLLHWGRSHLDRRLLPWLQPPAIRIFEALRPALEILSGQQEATRQDTKGAQPHQKGCSRSDHPRSHSTCRHSRSSNSPLGSALETEGPRSDLIEETLDGSCRLLGGGLVRVLGLHSDTMDSLPEVRLHSVSHARTHPHQDGLHRGAKVPAELR